MSTPNKPEPLAVARLIALGDLVGSVAHELNNPLAAIAGYAQLLASLPSDRLLEQRGCLDDLRDEANRCAQIVQNLLAFARTPSDDAPLRAPLHAVVAETIALKSHDFRLRNLEVETDIPFDAPIPDLDRGQVQLLLLNLLDHAIQALDSSDDRRIAVGVTSADDGVTLSLTYSACGVPLEGLDHDFGARTPGTSGLPTCVRILERTGGSITDSRTEAGGRITLRLPSAHVAQPI